MPDTSQKRATSAAIVTTIFSLVAGLIATTIVFSGVVLARDGVEVPGKVVEAHGSYKTGWVRIEFTTRTGELIRVKLNQTRWGAESTPGTAVRIRYLPDRPETFERAGSHASLISAPAIGFTLFAVGSAGLAVALWTRFLVVDAERRKLVRRRPPTGAGDLWMYPP